MNVDAQEAVWVTFAIVGLIASILGLLSAWADLRDLKRAGINSIRELVAKNSVFQESLRIIVLLFILLIAVPHLYRPAPPDRTWVTITPALGVVILTVLGTLSDRWTGYRVNRIVMRTRTFKEELREVVEQANLDQTVKENYAEIVDVKNREQTAREKEEGLHGHQH